MSYQVIARKWRPQTFGDVVGQNHVTQTLLNALKNGRIHHALLFTGPRGTGKTSSARILAKALRCPRAVDFVPCNQCPSCEEIAAGRSLDVQELDAASNNSVDDVRKLLDGVMNAPSSGRWKIYIIDEVHMLSMSAFNALLKTLEEPPAHVVFILATTEVQKIPATILSRCQRFDFKRIPVRQIIDHLKVVCQGEGVTADEDALWLVSRQGDGSMRDAQSLLDQVITFADGPLTKETVARILGLTDRALLLEALHCLAQRDTLGMLKLLERWASTGLEPRLFANELLESLRHLLVVKISGAEMSHILDLPDSELKSFADLGAPLTEEEIHLLFDMALKGAQDVSRAHDPHLVLEVVLLRMASAPRVRDLQSLFEGKSVRGELPAPGPTGHGTRPAPRLTDVAKTLKSEVDRLKTPEKNPAKETLPPPPRPHVNSGKTPEERWLLFVEAVRDNDAFFAAKIENLLFFGEKDRILRLGVPAKMTFLREQLGNTEARARLKGHLDSLWGQGYSFEVVSGAEPGAGPTARNLDQKKQRDQEEEIRRQVAEHPLVKAAQAVFESEIKSVLPTKEGASK